MYLTDCCILNAGRMLVLLKVVGLNFSSATTPELMLKTFDHYCEYKKTPNGLILSPIQLNKWLVLFCDEINLPDMDKYGISIPSSLSLCLYAYQCSYAIQMQSSQVYVLHSFLDSSLPGRMLADY